MNSSLRLVSIESTLNAVSWTLDIGRLGVDDQHRFLNNQNSKLFSPNVHSILLIIWCNCKQVVSYETGSYPHLSTSTAKMWFFWDLYWPFLDLRSVTGLKVKHIYLKRCGYINPQKQFAGFATLLSLMQLVICKNILGSM